MLKIERESDFQADISIVCITYNQAHLVESALKSFVEQKVNCNLEIVIHDDASTDNTAEVLKNFQRMHSDRVTLLLQSENQCQVPDVEVTCFTASHATGKYIALCEGDDYWIDPYKLQKQYDALEANPDLSASFHSAYTETPNGERNLFAHHSEDERKFTPQEVILGDGAFMPTSGLFCRKEAFSQITKELIITMPCGDYFFQIMASKDGGAYYFPEPMSVYRIQHSGSFTTNFSTVNWKKRTEFYRRMIIAMTLINEMTCGKYTSEIDFMKKKFQKIRRKCWRRGVKASLRKLWQQ